MRTVIRAFALAALLAAGCGARGKVADCGNAMTSSRTLSDGTRAEVAARGLVPGADLLVSSGPGEPARGLLCLTDSGRTLEGAPAFVDGRARVHDDALALAWLALVLLEDGVADKSPWAGGADGPSAAVGAGPPEVVGSKLVYWRRHKALADWVRVEVDLATLAVHTAREAEVLRGFGKPDDPLARARADLDAADVTLRQAAVSRLAALDGPAADALLLEVLAGNSAWLARRDVAKLLDARPAPGRVDALAAALLGDDHAKVRAQAAISLGRIGDPAGADALRKAAEGDADAMVRAQSTGALAKLGR